MQRTWTLAAIFCNAETGAGQTLSQGVLRMRKCKLLWAALFAVLLVFQPGTSNALTKVPPGNRHVKQPAIPSGSVSRTRSTNGSFQGKYEKIRDLLKSDKKLQAKIKKAARAYGIDPVHIIGALVGEHTYNVDALDRLQTYYVKALSYFNSDISFEHDSEKVTKFVQRQEFAKCTGIKDSYNLWACREAVWNAKFRGKKTGGKSWPNDRFGRVFFQPFYAGQTFGLGQLNPLTALRVTDVVNRTTGGRLLKASKPQQVYKTIMEPDSTLNYMAAVLKVSIDAYRTIGGFDISGNPGITSTLYNLGNVRERARKAKKRGGLPKENYYGWLVNDKIDELRAIVK